MLKVCESASSVGLYKIITSTAQDSINTRTQIGNCWTVIMLLFSQAASLLPAACSKSATAAAAAAGNAAFRLLSSSTPASSSSSSDGPVRGRTAGELGDDAAQSMQGAEGRAAGTGDKVEPK